VAVDPFDDSVDRYQQVASDEAQEHKNIFGSLLAGVGSIALGAAIYRGRNPGQNLIADLLHYINYGKGGGRGLGLTMKHLANKVDDVGSPTLGAGARSEKDIAIDLRTGGGRLERLDLVNDIVYMEEILGNTDFARLHGALESRWKQSIDERLKGANVKSFWQHNLERITFKEVMSEPSIWSERIGGQQFKVLERAYKKGWVKDNHMLDPQLFRDATGRVKDTRLASGKTVSAFAGIFDFFGQGKVVKSLLGTRTNVAVLPPAAKGQGAQFFINGGLYLGTEGGELAKIGSGLKLARTGDPLQIVRSLRRGRGRVGQGYIQDPKGDSFTDKLQRTLKIGPAYASRRSLFQWALIDPIRRAQGIASGEFSAYGKSFKYKGASGIAETPFIGGVFPEVGLGSREIVKTKTPHRGKGLSASQFHDLGLIDRVKILFGTHTDYEVIKTAALKKGSRLTEADKAIPIAHGGAKGIDPRWAPQDRRLGANLAEDSLTALGERSQGQRSKYYATPRGAAATAMDFANYSLARINSLASSFGLGIGFKLSGNPLKNAGRLAAIPVAYRAGIEGIGYADYLLEDLTGFSPIKSAASLYANLRLGQQETREALGITGVAGGLEQAYPGLVESEGMTLLRSIGLPGMAFLRGLRGGFAKALIQGAAAYGLFGGTGLSQPAEELRQEYAGERKIPVRRGEFWGLGYQPFFGGDISHFE
jgi:hypothetical protein